MELAEGAAVSKALFAGTTGVLDSRIDGPLWTLQVSAAHEAVPAVLRSRRRRQASVFAEA